MPSRRASRRAAGVPVGARQQRFDPVPPRRRQRARELLRDRRQDALGVPAGTERTGAVREVGTEPPCMADDIVGRDRAAQLVEEHRRRAPLRDVGVAQGDRGERGDGGQLEHLLGIVGVGVVERHVPEDLVPGAHRDLGDAARAGLTGDDVAQHDRDGTAEVLGRDRRHGRDAAAREHGVDHLEVDLPYIGDRAVGERGHAGSNGMV